jgi:hypothetical protein
MTKHTILFLAANPAGTDRLALDREARAIQVELERSGHRDRFELATRWAAEPLDLLRELRKLKPTVVHFSGHGGHGGPAVPRPDAAPRRDVVDGPVGGGGGVGAGGGALGRGLFFQGPDGQPQLVSTAALEQAFGAAGSSVRLVVLSACYSDAQAEALLAHIDCVVGMSGSISDDAARSFAIGFYGGLGEREPVAAAFLQGRAAISLEALHDGDLPQLRVRRGVDAGRLILAADAAVDAPAAVDAGMTRDQLLARLSGLLPAQFEAVLFRANIPPEYLSGATAPQAARAIDAIRYLEQRSLLPQLARIVRDVAGGGGRP